MPRTGYLSGTRSSDSRNSIKERSRTRRQDIGESKEASEPAAERGVRAEAGASADWAPPSPREREATRRAPRLTEPPERDSRGREFGREHRSESVAENGSVGSGSTAADSAYTNIRDRLVQLTIELDDQKRAAELLESALAKETAAGSEALRAVERDGARELREWQAAHKARVSELLGQVDSALASKRDLAQQVRIAATTATDAAAATAALAEDADATAARNLEAARVEWEAGAAARKEAHLKTAARSIREVTVKGMEPEIARLMSAHQADVTELERMGREQERAAAREGAEKLEAREGGREPRERSRESRCSHTHPYVSIPASLAHTFSF